eukprot:maker-scaffold11_size778918-snap-gene-6.40 protein:Tk03680 transcript:maker-scaffold11_size778918-snap-gene-6.40-mRNA-1 annotation:"single-stranded dna-binding mitochondrial-like"
MVFVALVVSGQLGPIYGTGERLSESEFLSIISRPRVITTRISVNMALSRTLGLSQRLWSSSSALVSLGHRACSTEDTPAPPPMSAGPIEKSINNVTLLGRVGVDPQLRGTDRHPVVTFSLATNVRYRSNTGEEEERYAIKTDWHNIAVYRPYLRDTVQQNVTKGQRVLVQGRIMYGSIEDNLGNVRQTTTVVAEDIIRFA